MVQFVSYLRRVVCKPRQKTHTKHTYISSAARSDKNVCITTRHENGNAYHRVNALAYSPVREATGIPSVSPAYRGIKMEWLWSERPLIIPVIPLRGGGEFQMTGVLIHFSNSCKNDKRNSIEKRLALRYTHLLASRTWNFTRKPRKQNTRYVLSLNIMSRSRDPPSGKEILLTRFQIQKKVKFTVQISFAEKN